MALFLSSTRSKAGFTLLELCLVLCLAGTVWSVLLPAARRQRDRMAVVGAREELLGLIHRTRAEAIARGGAELGLSTDPASAWISCTGDTIAWARIGETHGVTLRLSGSRREETLIFGPLGLGQVASQTMNLERGEEKALLVVSSLGRAIRR